VAETAPHRSAASRHDPALRPAILIPAYESAETVGGVARDARPCGLPIVVVDDGSTDGTATQAAAAGAEVVRHDANRGKGAALVTGMRHLAACGFTHALTMDADGQHLAREIPKLLAAARAEPEAIVIGTRTIGGQAVASINLLGNRVANLAVRIAAGRSLGDTQSGFRVYPLAAVLRLPRCGERFEYETTVVIHAARAGVPIRSVDVDVYYPPIAERRSHYRKVVDTLRIIRAVAPLVLRRSRGGSPHLRR
jgi:glycosyltransferase involved in cell wall biosynthesis